MKLLDSDKGWELLLKKAFMGSTNKCPQELDSIRKCLEDLQSTGKQILEKCDGLPIAISAVVDLLVEAPTGSKWEQVLNQINFHLGRAESVSAVLELSYENLSPHLKSCFLWLAFFKKNSTIPAKRLVNIWDAQHLIQQEGSRTIDQIARGYLNELINRSMVQIQDLTVDGQVKSCRVHDLLHEVCLRKSKEEIGLQIVNGEEGISSESSYKPRHRVVYGENLETSPSNQNKYLRSLFLLSCDHYMITRSHYWKSYQLLKTLELHRFSSPRLPNSLRSLIGLTCLRINKFDSYNFLLELPNWLDHLKNLEVLDIGRMRVLLPRLVSLKMDRLRYFGARIILCGGTKINIWKSIECLKNITHKDWMRCRSNITSGCRLRELGMRFDGEMEPQELMKVRASLEKMQNLVILRLMSTYDKPDMGLAMPHLANLSKVKLTGNLPKCPDASMFPPNLSHLTLEYSNLRDDPMAELGKLPKLFFLKIQNGAYSGENMQVLCGRFPCLEALTLERLKLKAIVIQEGGMPQLKHVRIRQCPDLETRKMSERINISD